MKKYNPKLIEQKWQKYWEGLKLFEAKDFSPKPKQYLLVEFPYPSADGLHVGHIRPYTALDVLAKKKKMEGDNVLYPIGWDAFGLPTENYAIKTGIHPAIVTKKNIKVFKKQLKSLGFSFDWSREINTTDPEYYKWTQWIFLQFFKRGLAYQAEMPINWCPACKIGLANEEVVNGKCERCGVETERRKIKQWMLKITTYAERLISDLEKVDYLEKIKTQQINWIGRSFGTTIKFQIADKRGQNISADPRGKNQRRSTYIEVFTTRVDTIFGVTALVVAPEHPFVAPLLKIKNQKSKIKNVKEVDDYIEQAKKKSEFERTKIEKEKTGVEIKGIRAVNPINNEEIPIFVGDYVIAFYGGGAVMVVPAHDARDYDFAKKYHLPIRQVITPINADIRENPRGNPRESANNEEAFVEDGVLINSGEFSGLKSEEARKKITVWLEKNGLGRKTVQYKLRDWIFSRQHYWGEPIPLVFCQACASRIIADKDADKRRSIRENQRSNQRKSAFSEGELLNPGWIAVSENKLPVKLPYVKKYEPTDTGESPLAKIEKWVKTKCPKCKGPAKRETDTMPNWAGSNWYYLRYLDPRNDKVLAERKKIEYWMAPARRGPKGIGGVDWYNGGMEHTTLHLLYSRFVYKFLYDLGLVPQSEPYQKRTSHGMVLAEDGRKMSKSFGNVINPDEIIKNYGADSLRVYEMFMGPFDQAINWSTQGLLGCYRFLKRIWFLFHNQNKIGPSSQEIKSKLHQLIKKVSDDLETMKFNTAIAAFMEFINFWSLPNEKLSQKEAELFLKILAPFVPHLAEELFQHIRVYPRLSTFCQRKSVSRPRQSVFQERWPAYDKNLLQEKEFELVIQVNGRVRDKIKVGVNISEEEVKNLAQSREKIKKYLASQTIKKVIFVPKKLINFVID